jgi:hypothetical protein
MAQTRSVRPQATLPLKRCPLNRRALSRPHVYHAIGQPSPFTAVDSQSGYSSAMGRYIHRHWLAYTLCLAGICLPAPVICQQPTSSSIPTVPSESHPLPPIRNLLLDVEHNEKLAEAARKDYTFHVHIQLEDLEGNGNVKKTTTTDAEDLTIDGISVHRVVARNGEPLTPEEAQKESDRIDKEVAAAKDRRAKRQAKGQDTDARGDVILPASRILELGYFSNPRRIELDGRPTIVVDYAGDPNAKTRNEFEGIVRDLVGTAWIDEQDRVLVRGEGHFLNNFKIGGGLILNIHKGFSFDFRATKINGEVWLPAAVDGQGSARILLVDKVDGRFNLTTSDYRKFRASSTIIQSDRIIGTYEKPEPAQRAPVPRATNAQQPQ